MAKISSHFTLALGDDIAWKSSYDTGLASALAAVPIERTTKIHFSSFRGNDTTGDGTADNPYQSLSKMATELASASSDTALLIERGSVYREGDAWVADYGSATEVLDLAAKSDITIGAYGTGDRPKITAFVAIGDTWTLDASTNSYYLDWTEATYGAVGWVKNTDYEDDTDYPCMHAGTSQANLETLNLTNIPQGGFWYDTTIDRLYVRISNGAGSLKDPTGVVEVAPLNTVKFIDSDNAVSNRVDSLFLEGWGCYGTGQNYAIMLQPSASNYNVVSNCRADYSGKHAIGMYSGAGYSTEATTGIICIDCEASGCLDGSPGIAFATNGGHELIYHNCSCVWDIYQDTVAIEYADFQDGSGKKRGWFAHTSVNDVAFAIAYGCSNVDTRYGPFETVSIANRPAAAALTNCKVFIANCTGTHYALRWKKGVTTIIADAQCCMNNHFVFYQIGAATNTRGMICQSNASAKAWAFNCTWEHYVTGEVSAPSAQLIGLMNQATTSENILVNCHIKQTHSAGVASDTAVFADADNDAATLHWCIIEHSSDAGDSWVGIADDGIPDVHVASANAVLDTMDYDASTGWQDTVANDTALVELTAAPTLGAMPLHGSQLHEVAAAGSPPHTLNYDRYWQRRPSTPSIGPVEFRPKRPDIFATHHEFALMGVDLL